MLLHVLGANEILLKTVLLDKQGDRALYVQKQMKSRLFLHKTSGIHVTTIMVSLVGQTIVLKAIFAHNQSEEAISVDLRN